jgi:twinkle protein
MDDVGRKACLEVAKMLPPGKASIASLPRKDPSDMLVAGEGELLQQALFKAVPYSPSGVISTHALRGKAMSAPTWGLRMGIPFLDNLQWGWRDGEVLVQGGGTGMGKSDTAMQVCAHIIRPRPASPEDEQPYLGTRCGFINYEQPDPETTMKGIAGKLFEKRFDRPDPDGIYWTQPELDAALAYMDEVCASVFFNDDDMPRGWDPFEERVRYLYHAEGVKRFFGDPMAAFAADMEDERKGIDRMMAHAKDLCKELGIGIWFNSHLARPKEGPIHEEGGQVRMSHFRGSGAITMWADLVWGIERNTQAEDPLERQLTTYRALKVRKAGEKTGDTKGFIYNVLTGILEPAKLSLAEQGSQHPEPPENYEGYTG